jgi:hypothetical protein
MDALVRCAPADCVEKVRKGPFCRPSQEPCKIGFLSTSPLESEFAAPVATGAVASNSFQRAVGVACRADFFNRIRQMETFDLAAKPQADFGKSEKACRGQPSIHERVKRNCVGSRLL